jgi:type II secretory pathway pseudopilin PulG
VSCVIIIVIIIIVVVVVVIIIVMTMDFRVARRLMLLASVYLSFPLTIVGGNFRDVWKEKDRFNERFRRKARQDPTFDEVVR